MKKINILVRPAVTIKVPSESLKYSGNCYYLYYANLHVKYDHMCIRRGCLNPRRPLKQFLYGFVNISKQIPPPLKARVQTSTRPQLFKSRISLPTG